MSGVVIHDKKKLCWDDSTISSASTSSSQSKGSKTKQNSIIKHGNKKHEEKQEQDNKSETNGEKTKSETEEEYSNPRNRCCHGGKAFFDALKAMVTRQIFLLHSLVVVWKATSVAGNLSWLLMLFALPQMVETLIVLLHRRGQEWKWVSPCVLLYLACTVPGIWVLELSINEVTGGINSTTTTSDMVSFGAISIDLTVKTWTYMLEQVMLVLIIVGRWLLPKGELTREQLSGLLLAYLGTASDIIDFFNITQEDESLGHSKFLYVVLLTWTWSLIQFAFVRTVTFDGKSNEELEEMDEQNIIQHSGNVGNNNDKIKRKTGSLWMRLWKKVKVLLETEVWSITLGLVMQDGPFLIIRVITISYFRIFTSTNLFFLVKNLLVIILQVYRLIALYREHEEKKRQEKEEKTKKLLRTLYRSAFFLGRVSNKRSVDPVKITIGMDYEDVSH